MSHDKGLKFAHVNVRSIFRKIKQLEFLYNDIDFLFCPETWLDNRYSDNMCTINNMKIFRCDRKDSMNSYVINNIGGGVCIYVNQKCKDFADIWKCGSVITSNYEIVTVLITKPNFRKLALFCIYKPPKGSVKELIDF